MFVTRILIAQATHYRRIYRFEFRRYQDIQKQSAKKHPESVSMSFFLSFNVVVDIDLFQNQCLF